MGIFPLYQCLGINCYIVCGQTLVTRPTSCVQLQINVLLCGKYTEAYKFILISSSSLQLKLAVELLRPQARLAGVRHRQQNAGVYIQVNSLFSFYVWRRGRDGGHCTCAAVTVSDRALPLAPPWPWNIADSRARAYMEVL